jgi:hypothetical protein
MAGVYVAKPDDAVVPDYPPGWNPSWDWPGPPFPPGYAPSYAHHIECGAYYIPGASTSDLSVSLLDGGYATSAPSGNVVYTAKIGADTVGLRQAGESAFTSAVSVAYSLSDGLYGNSPTLQFDVTALNIGETITLYADGSPFGSALTQQHADMLVAVESEPGGVVVNPTSGLETTSDGGTDSFSVVLTREPSASVTIAVESDDSSEGVADVASITFGQADWNVPQEVTVTGVDDEEDTDTVAYNIILGNATSSDAGYNGLSVSDVSVTNNHCDEEIAPVIIVIKNVENKVAHFVSNGACTDGVFCPEPEQLCNLSIPVNDNPSFSLKALVDGMEVYSGKMCSGQWRIYKRQYSGESLYYSHLEKYGNWDSGDEGVIAWAGDDILESSYYYNGTETTYCVCASEGIAPYWPWWCGLEFSTSTYSVSVPGLDRTWRYELVYYYTPQLA